MESDTSSEEQSECLWEVNLLQRWFRCLIFRHRMRMLTELKTYLETTFVACKSTGSETGEGSERLFLSENSFLRLRERNAWVYTQLIPENDISERGYRNSLGFPCWVLKDLQRKINQAELGKLFNKHRFKKRPLEHLPLKRARYGTRSDDMNGWLVSFASATDAVFRLSRIYIETWDPIVHHSAIRFQRLSAFHEDDNLINAYPSAKQDREVMLSQHSESNVSLLPQDIDATSTGIDNVYLGEPSRLDVRQLRKMNTSNMMDFKEESEPIFSPVVKQCVLQLAKTPYEIAKEETHAMRTALAFLRWQKIISDKVELARKKKVLKLSKKSKVTKKPRSRKIACSSNRGKTREIESKRRVEVLRKDWKENNKKWRKQHRKNWKQTLAVHENNKNKFFEAASHHWNERQIRLDKIAFKRAHDNVQAEIKKQHNQFAVSLESHMKYMGREMWKQHKDKKRAPIRKSTS